MQRASVDQSMKKEGKSSLEGKTKGDGDQERVEKNKQRRKEKKKRIRKALGAHCPSRWKRAVFRFDLRLALARFDGNQRRTSVCVLSFSRFISPPRRKTWSRMVAKEAKAVARWHPRFSYFHENRPLRSRRQCHSGVLNANPRKEKP